MKIVKQLSAIAKSLDCNFFLKEEAISYDKVFAPDGLLPSFMRRADQLASFCLGHGLGCTFDRADGSLMGVRVDFDDSTSNILRILCITDVLIEIMQQSPSFDKISLDSLMME